MTQPITPDHPIPEIGGWIWDGDTMQQQPPADPTVVGLLNPAQPTEDATSDEDQS